MMGGNTGNSGCCSPPASASGNAKVAELLDRYVMRTYNRLPVALVRGEGCRVWDADGKEYLDFLAGLAVNGLGHCHPKVVQAVKEQVEKLIHCSNLYHIEPQARLAQYLVQHSAMKRVFFCNSGAEANEAAIKLARKHGRSSSAAERFVIVSATGSFHGRTLAALAATGQTKYQKGFEPIPQGFEHVPFNDLEAMEACLAGNGSVCGVLLEPIQGEVGVHPATPEYLQGVRKLCDSHKLLLIFDEIQTGLGRTGKMFAYEHYGVVPDILTLAKSLAGGLPIGAMLATEKAASAFEPGNHASTFGGNPLVCEAALAALTALEEENLVENARAMGDYFVEKLGLFKNRFGFIREIRGKGLMLAMELERGGEQVFRRCLELGLLTNLIGTGVLRFLPPLVVVRPEIDRAISILHTALGEV